MASKLKAGSRPLGFLCVAAVVLLAACAKSSSTTTAGSGGTGGTPAQGGGAVTISTASVSGMGTVLVDSSGMVLYYLKTESNGQIQCTGSCATAWPPVLLPSGTSSATAGSGVTGKLGTIARPDGGTQVTYDNMPLYTFASDQPGEATGQGINNFFVETPSGSSSSGGGNGGGGGYGGRY
jgi:predicted lipoprotein with Yx(FWY)xxD motif